MGVKAGFKQTEAGIVPEDWNAPKLGSILKSTQLGGNYKNSERETNWPLIKMGNLGRGSISLARLEFVDSSCKPDAKDRLHRDDILLNTRNTLDLVGKVAAWRDELPEAYFNSNIMRMEFDGEFVSSKRLMNYVLNTPQSVKGLRAIAIGTTSVAAVYGRDLVKVVVALPPKSEQKGIAEALSDADALIESLEQLLSKKRQIKQGAMQELLRGKRRLPGFNDKWKLRRLGELGRWVGGMTPSMANPAYWEAGAVPWISSGDVKSALLLTTAFPITDRAIKETATTLLPAMSVVVVTRSGILRKYLPVAMNLVPMAINQDIKAILPKRDVVPEYLLHTLIGHGDQILARCLKSGTTVESIEFQWLKAFEVQVPPPTEQAAIAAVLSDMDAELAALETKLTKARQIKQGMMQELLTGRIRLV
jgi:type I restriction enzyme S subunit